MQYIFILLFIVNQSFLIAQDEDALFIKNIHNEILSNGKSYEWLTQLCTQYPGRLAGSDQDVGAAKYMRSLLKTIGVDTTYFQECEANYWKRGDKEEAYMILPDGDLTALKVLSLGGSGSTNAQGLAAQVIEVISLGELENMNEEDIISKIVFFNRPMDPTHIRTFSAYGGAVDQRVFGPARASKKGAVAALVRSMTLRKDDIPHTGVTIFGEGENKIPALAISTNDADRLSAAIKEAPTYVNLNTSCEDVGLRPTFNVVGEIKGNEFPDEIILVGGHLDSWDVGQGAHDDGSGCVQSVEVLNTLIAIGYQPKRTIRCVLFANEENGLAGGKEYAKISNENGEFHLAALESDAGGFSPRGFSFEADTSVFKKYYKSVSQWLPELESYGLQFEMGGSGADIGPLKSQKGLLIGLRPDSQRYFDYHHTEIDTIDAVNERELKLGAAAMTSLVYLIDKYGLE